MLERTRTVKARSPQVSKFGLSLFCILLIGGAVRRTVLASPIYGFIMSCTKAGLGIPRSSWGVLVCVFRQILGPT